MILQEAPAIRVSRNLSDRTAQPRVNGIKAEEESVLGPYNDVDACIIPMFGQTEVSLQGNLKALQSYLNRRSDVTDFEFWPNLVHTMTQRRTPFPWRCAIAATDPSSLKTQLEQGPMIQRASEVPRIAFVFTGQGAQWPQMGRRLMCYPVFCAYMEAAERHLRALGADWSLKGSCSTPLNTFFPVSDTPSSGASTRRRVFKTRPSMY